MTKLDCQGVIRTLVYWRFGLQFVIEINEPRDLALGCQTGPFLLRSCHTE